MTERTVLTFDLGILGRELDLARMQALVGQEAPFRWNDQEAPSRVIAVTSEDDRMKVTVEIDGEIDWLDQGLTVSPGSGTSGTEAGDMTDAELRDALDGLFAYDSGAVDSGIHDEALRARCMAEITSRPRTEHEIVPRLFLSRLVRDMWLSEEALEQGYGIEDAVKFLTWLENQMMWGLVF